MSDEHPAYGLLRPVTETASVLLCNNPGLLTHATKQILDQWGADGWELVAVLPGPTGEQHVAYLKRPK